MSVVEPSLIPPVPPALVPSWVMDLKSFRAWAHSDEYPERGHFAFYWKAGVPEFWLVDARQSPAEFQIFKHSPQGYDLQPSQEMGAFPPLFGRFFQLIQGEDPLGKVSFEVKIGPELSGGKK